jgi:hypothetical protein
MVFQVFDRQRHSGSYPQTADTRSPADAAEKFSRQSSSDRRSPNLCSDIPAWPPFFDGALWVAAKRLGGDAYSRDGNRAADHRPGTR